MQESVKQDREKWLGGSDIPVILGISPFKTRWQLLREKAGLEKPEEVNNPYVRYGNDMESKIRDYVNDTLFDDEVDAYFREGKHVEDGEPIGFREHTDGENEDTVLEIKTTGGNIPIEVYEAQLLWYMKRTHKDFGLLEIYNRPEDMSTEFDPDRLEYREYYIYDYAERVNKMVDAVMQFIADLKALNDNPFLSEQDLMPTELVAVANQVIRFEQRLAQLKEEEKAIKAEKQKLFDAMLSSNVKKWETLHGYLITRVDAIPEGEKEVEEFCEEKFAEEHPKMYKKYTQTLTIKTSGRAGYVKITPPKGVK